MRHSGLRFLSSIIIPSSAVFNPANRTLCLEYITSQNNPIKLIEKGSCSVRIIQHAFDGKRLGLCGLKISQISKEVACNLNQNALNSFANHSINS